MQQRVVRGQQQAEKATVVGRKDAMSTDFQHTMGTIHNKRGGLWMREKMMCYPFGAYCLLISGTRRTWFEL